MPLPRLIEVEEFFANPELAGAQVSPDGTRLAYLAPKYGRLQVWVRGIDEEHSDAVCVTRDERRGIHKFHWIEDPRFLIYLQDTDGNEDWHLYRVDLRNPEAAAVDLTPLPAGQRAFGLTELKAHPGKLAVPMNTRVTHIDLFLVDIETGEKTLLLESAEPGEAFQLGKAGDVWFARTDASDGAHELYAVEDDGTKRLLARFDGPTYPLGMFPMETVGDGSGLLLGGYFEDEDDLSVLRVDRATGEITQFASFPGHSIDVSGLLTGAGGPIKTSKATDDVIAVRFVGPKPEWKVVDPAFQPVFDALAAISDGVVGNMNSDAEGRRWVVTFLDDRDPGRTYLYDHETGESRFLFRAFPKLDPAELAPMTPVSFPARDGLPLHGLLTLPLGVEPAGLPLVCLVHGGPWYHDSWGYSAEAQLLANRGYAVLQVNFRGSSGYGKRHQTAAIREFAGAMHTDLIDGCEWAVTEGYADPTRLAIYGGSYGGYAALVGVTVTAGYFAAAVDYCGISDLANFQRTLPPFARALLRNNWGAYVGDPDVPEDERDMLARSPITMVDKIVTPLLVAQGANDARVVQAEADNMVEALRGRGVAVEYVLAEDEGHGFANPENNFRFYRAMERHFGRHLGGRVSTSATTAS